MARDQGTSPADDAASTRLWTTGRVALTPMTWRVSREPPATSESRPPRKETAMQQPRVIVVGNQILQPHIQPAELSWEVVDQQGFGQ